VVDRDTLPAHYEAELPLVIGDALGGLPIPPVRIQVNNRKLCEGYLSGLGLVDPAPALQAIDKLDKIGPGGVIEQLLRSDVTDGQAKAILAFAEIHAPDLSFVDAVRALGVEHPLLDEGLAELIPVIAAASEHAPGLVVADMRIVRGLDYYTGTVYEARLHGYERFGSVCAGGRYDNLATSGADRFPGVGLSIGVSRLLGLLFGAGAGGGGLTVSRQVPTCVLVALPTEDDRSACNRVAAALRSRGVATEVAPSAAKYGTQIRFAERRGIPYVWFPGAADASDEVRDIRSGEQAPADSATWAPPTADLRPRVTGV
jgi:histidyl-tRNA synthetase